MGTSAATAASQLTLLMLKFKSLWRILGFNASASSLHCCCTALQLCGGKQALLGWVSALSAYCFVPLRGLIQLLWSSPSQATLRRSCTATASLQLCGGQASAAEVGSRILPRARAFAQAKFSPGVFAAVQLSVHRAQGLAVLLAAVSVYEDAANLYSL